MLKEKALPNKETLARWEVLKNRLVQEVSRGISVTRIANETGLMAAQIEAWANDPAAFRDAHRVIGQPSLAESIESAIETRFAELDAERKANPARIETSVMLKAMNAFSMARGAIALVDFTAPSGAGKSEAIAEYVARCRREEGFSCPIWVVELDEYSLSSKAVLTMIAEKMKGVIQTGSEHELARRIETYTEGKGGLLIVDEAQHLGDAQNINGLKIINGLRRFVDRKLFGIALVNNGEIYRRVQAGKHAQLASRMAAWRVEVGGVTDDDVDRVMAAWGVSGRREREYCIKAAAREGCLRAFTEVFRSALEQWGFIDCDVMMRIKRVA